MITVHTLGTGSGKPTPERNVSCTAVFREGELVLFDCGEGTQTQIARSQLRPGVIQVICITHFHGDHINGLPGLLGTLQLNQRTEPLTVIGPKGLKQYLQTLSRLNILGVGYGLNLIEVTEPGVVYEGNGYAIATERLRHRVPCWGYRMFEPPRPGKFNLEQARALGVPAGPMFGRLQRGEAVTLEGGEQIQPEDVLGPARPGLALAYCCDTQPCDGAVRLAGGADLLIHEGTYGPGEEKLAHARGHSTMLDAARTARDAGVRELIITHISQKYTRIEGFAKKVREVFPQAHFARDLNVFELKYNA